MSTAHTTRHAHEQLHEGVRGATRRGRLLVSLSAVLIGLAMVVSGLFVVAVKDVLLVLPSSLRLGCLVALLLGATLLAVVRTVRPWLNLRFHRAAGAQMDRVAKAPHQPVTLALSLQAPADDDALGLTLKQRAEERAAQAAQAIKPREVYPWRRLRSPGHWLLLALGLWLMLVLILPSQAWAIASRVFMPWGQAPPFTLTQLEPTWTPAPPNAGDDVVVMVTPKGRMPESVLWVRLNEQGNEVEQFVMDRGRQRAFRLRLRQVESPVVFRLEAFGRHTRSFTITPTPRPPTPDPPDQSDEPADGPGGDRDGTTTFDPKKVAQRELEAHRDWPGLKQKLQSLLDELTKAEQAAKQLNPADLQAIQDLANKLAQLVGQASGLAAELDALQGTLPDGASKLLDELASALSNLEIAALDGPASQADGATPNGNTQSLEQWLAQAGAAAKADQQQVGQGLGPSDQPTASGATTGQAGDDRSDIRDPGTSGTSTNLIPSGDAGPLPDSVMRQIPLRYRDFVSAYFEQLADE